MDKLILTIDSDAFFASCEEAKDPSLKKVPMVVAHKLNNRGVINTANYLAREFGLKGGMPLFQAKEKCKNLVIIEPDFDYYQQKANEVFAVIGTFTNKMQVASIDECFVDVTHLLVNGAKPIEIAKRIQKKVMDLTKVSVSVGISTNTFLSKMASNFDKPYGVSTLYKHEIQNKMWPLDVIELHFLGKQTAKKLNEHGIYKIGQLAKIKDDVQLYEELKRIMGVNFDKLISTANGEGTDEIVTLPNDAKSISKERTLETSTSDIKQIEKIAYELLKIVVKKLENRNFVGKTITVVLKDHGSFKKYSARTTLPQRTNKMDVLWLECQRIIDDIYVIGKTIKQVGVSVSNLSEESKTYKQTDLFNSVETKDTKEITNIFDFIDPKLQRELKLATGKEYKENRKYNKAKTVVEGDNIKFKNWSD